MDTLFVFVVAGWFALALALGWFMGRHGHDGFGWTVMGTVLGPLAAVLAVVHLRHPALDEPFVVRRASGGRPARDRDGARGMSVLVGMDGSPSSRAALQTVERLFADRAERVTLARVVPVNPSHAARTGAVAALDDETRATPLDASAVLLHGEAAMALREHAKRERYDVLAVGTRGVGMSRALLGSVASALARGSPVPVLLVDATSPMSATDDAAVTAARAAS